MFAWALPEAASDDVAANRRTRRRDKRGKHPQTRGTWPDKGFGIVTASLLQSTSPLVVFSALQDSSYSSIAFSCYTCA